MGALPQVVVRIQRWCIYLILSAIPVALEPHPLLAQEAAVLDTLREYLTVTLRYQNFSYINASQRDPERFRNEGFLRIKYVQTFWDTLTLVAIPTVQVDDADLHRGVVDQITDRSERRKILDVEEFYLEYTSQLFDVRVGKQIYNWGKADGINPSDHLSTVDLTDLVDDRDIGIFSTRVNFFLGADWILETVWSPFFTPIRLAPRGTRFSFIPDGSPIRLNPRELPPTSLGHSQYGLRLLGFVGPVDLSLIWYDGINDAPVSRREGDGSVTPIFNKISVLGANVAFNTGKIGWRGEVGYRMTDGPRADDFIQYVIGVDRTFADVFIDHDLYILIQYVRLDVTSKARDQASGGISQAFTNTAIGLFRYEFSDDTELELRATINLDECDHLIEAQLSHNFSDIVELIIGGTVLGGDKATFFGQFDKNDRVFLRVTMTL